MRLFSSYLELFCKLGQGTRIVVQDVRLVILTVAQCFHVLLGNICSRTEALLIFLA